MKKAILSVLLLLGLALFIMGCGKQEDTVDVDSLAQAGADEATLLAVEDAEAELGDDEALVAEGSGAIAGQAVKKAGSKKKAKVEYLSCEDSDSGENKDIAGYVEVKSTYNGGERSQVIIDRYYSSNGRFYERYCVGNRHRSRVLTCDNGAEEVDVSDRMAWQCSAPPVVEAAPELLVCWSAGVGNTAECAEGEVCRINTPNASNSQRYCLPRGNAGEACIFDAHCASEFRCAGNVAGDERWTCVARLAAGADCTRFGSDNPCGVGLYCVPSLYGLDITSYIAAKACRVRGTNLGLSTSYCEIASHCCVEGLDGCTESFACARNNETSIIRQCRSYGSAQSGDFCDSLGSAVCPGSCDEATNRCS